MLTISPIVIGFPLSTEDTGTLGNGRTKVELIKEWTEERESGSREVSITHELSMTHGLHDTLNVFFTLPYREVHTHAADISTRFRGIGDVKFGMKWRYFQRGNVNLGFKVMMTAPTGSDAEELGNGKATQSINALVSYGAGSWEFNVDLGYRRNQNTLNQREQIGSFSAAVMRSLDSRWKILADIGMASNKSKRSKQALTYLGAGLSFLIVRDMSLEAGLKRGLTSAETDYTGTFGLNLNF